jgi:hypothetical protein
MRPDPHASSFGETVEAFAAALVNPATAPPAQTRGREGLPDGRRFAVYRNNVAVSLIASLAARYPVTRRLVGEDFFRAMARAYTAAEKPKSPVLIHYGGSFPAFIADFEPARNLPYLADVARLENAWVEAYHAAEAAPLTLVDLAGLDAESLAAARFDFHPATRILASDHPVASIWAAHQGPGEVAPIESWRPEQALITRPAAEVLLRALPPGGYAFVDALLKGASVADAHEAADVEDFDAGAHVVGLLEAGALAGLKTQGDR